MNSLLHAEFGIDQLKQRANRMSTIDLPVRGWVTCRLLIQLALEHDISIEQKQRTDAHRSPCGVAILWGLLLGRGFRNA